MPCLSGAYVGALTGAQWLANHQYAALKQDKLISASEIVQDRWVLFIVGLIMDKRRIAGVWNYLDHMNQQSWSGGFTHVSRSR